MQVFVKWCLSAAAVTKVVYHVILMCEKKSAEKEKYTSPLLIYMQIEEWQPNPTGAPNKATLAAAKIIQLMSIFSSYTNRPPSSLLCC